MPVGIRNVLIVDFDLSRKGSRDGSVVSSGGASRLRRTVSMFSCDIAYSERPAA